MARIDMLGVPVPEYGALSELFYSNEVNFEAILKYKRDIKNLCKL